LHIQLNDNKQQKNVTSAHKGTQLLEKRNYSLATEFFSKQASKPRKERSTMAFQMHSLILDTLTALI
jgi:hypothetical protein